MKTQYETYTQRQKRILIKRRRKARIRKIRFLSALLFTLVSIAFVSVYFLGSPKKTSTLTTLAKHIVPTATPLSKPETMTSDEIRKKIEDLASYNDAFIYVKEHYDSYPEDLLFSLCNNPEMIDYVLGYLSANPNHIGTLSKAELASDSPLLLQWDKRWGYASYGSSQIALSGCAPTCLSMVILSLTHEESVTPYTVATFAEEEGYYVPGTGTSWSLMTEGINHFGVTGQELSLDKNSIYNALDHGHPIICSMSPGDFTTQGHFIVLSKTMDGKIVVHDPNSLSRSNVLWDYETLEPQIKNLWVFSKN